MIRIYADFNECDELGRAVLSIPGSRADIEKFKDQLVPGLRVVLYQSNELEVEGTLEFKRGWLGVPDWTTIKYYEDSPGSGS